jgi:glycerol uptake facilitator-like aquaporin
MDERMRRYLAELLGTFALVFFGAGAVCASFVPSPPQEQVWAIALAEGLTLGIALTAAYRLSPGCLNPALALMQYVFKRLEGAELLALILMQLLGASLAGLALRAIFGWFSDSVLHDSHLGTPYLKGYLSEEGVTLGGLVVGTAVEMLLTALIAVALLATLLDEQAPRLGGFGVGFAQVAVVAVGYHLTGGAANPARWFGPLIWQYTLPTWPTTRPLADHAVYWAGPVLGALLGGVLYSAVMQPRLKR